MFLHRIIRHNSLWKSVPKGPPDAILGISEAFKRDKNPRKVNLGVGAYRDDSGKPVILPSVQKAKSLIIKSSDHEYLPIDGLAKFTQLATSLAYSNASPLKDHRVASIQSISGTGALRLGMAFIQRFYPHSRRVYIPNPTWGNHKTIIQHAGLEFQEYPYYDPVTKGLNIEAFLNEIDSAPKNSVFLLHACAHNPTGVDPSEDQWKQIQDVMARKQHLAVFDMAYQGFASGDVDKDAYAVRLFANEENPIIVMQSFAKNFGLYGERIGNLSVVCDSKQESDRVLSQLKILARPMYSNPPIYGSRIVSEVLGNEELKKQWLVDVKTMADRIISMRNALTTLLKEKGSLHDWSHITKQIGMFAYTGLHPEHCQELMDKHHIYLTMDGRISVAGLNQRNVEYVADAIETVTRFKSKL
ncbi:hypothetical protein SteCoe_14424 [Stentor coeruleus]|uniref:Aspartate aminotransferase n=1 Tax=Stentor coeruleus TaxID=5963 RepID=A0A1R2C664_9CILI|nr:hypothetical protein SteCoe_14424 [Stentor coeruleus]